MPAVQKNISFASAIQQDKALVYDLRITLQGEERYFIVKVLPSKHSAFRLALQRSDGFRLEDFGEIVFRGWNEPSPELKAQLQREFGLSYA